jgi:ribonuclease HI
MLDPKHPNISKKEIKYALEGFWKMSFDGGFSKYGSGVGIVFKIPNSIIYPHAIRLEFPCTNNKAECRTLIQGMNIALQMKVEHLIITGDSELVINHIKNKYNIKNEKLKNYAKRVNELMNSFSLFNISFIPRDKNHKVDSLAVVASLFNPNN